MKREIVCTSTGCISKGYCSNGECVRRRKRKAKPEPFPEAQYECKIECDHPIFGCFPKQWCQWLQPQNGIKSMSWILFS